MNDYIKFWYSKNGNPSRYTNWIGTAAWQRYLLNGNSTFIESIADGLAKTFRSSYVPIFLKEAGGKKCWYNSDGADAMEVSASGSGCRPTIASAMYGEAECIVNIAKLMGNVSLKTEFEAWQELSRSVVLDLHWNSKVGMFSVIPLEPTGSTPSTAAKGCNLTSLRVVNETVNVRELLGYMPFYFDTLIPDNVGKGMVSSWKYIFDKEFFSGPFGLRSLEFGNVCYNYSYSHGDC